MKISRYFEMKFHFFKTKTTVRMQSNMEKKNQFLYNIKKIYSYVLQNSKTKMFTVTFVHLSYTLPFPI